MLLYSLFTITSTLTDIHCLTVVIDSRKKRPKDATAPNQNQGNQPPEDPSNTSLFEEKSSIFGSGSGGSGTGGKSKSSSGGASSRLGRLTHAQLRELEAAKEREIVRGYKRVCELWGRTLNGISGSGEEDQDQEAVREWMVEAEKMVETFRETRNLFLTSRVGSSVSPPMLLLGRLMMGSFCRRIRLGGCSLGRSQKVGIRIGKRRGTRRTKRGWHRGYILRWVCFFYFVG